MKYKVCACAMHELSARSPVIADLFVQDCTRQPRWFQLIHPVSGNFCCVSHLKIRKAALFFKNASTGFWSFNASFIKAFSVLQSPAGPGRRRPSLRRINIVTLWASWKGSQQREDSHCHLSGNYRTVESSRSRRGLMVSAPGEIRGLGNT